MMVSGRVRSTSSGRDEVLVAQEGGEVGVHVLDRAGQGGLRGRGLPEGANHPRGLLDGFQSLAADIADDESGEALGDAAVVEVPADDRVRCGGQVPGRSV